MLRDFVLIGTVAFVAYGEAIQTFDADVVILVDSDSEYYQTLQRLAEFAEKWEGDHFYFSGTPVQVLPTTTKPLFRDAFDQAKSARVGATRVKVASPEHLIVLALERFSYKDRVKAEQLLEFTSEQRVRELLEKFHDQEGHLTTRFDRLLRERRL